MSSQIPQSLKSWLISINLQQHLSKNQLLNGTTVNKAMQFCIEGYNLQLLKNDTVTNWNTIIQELNKVSITINQTQKQAIHQAKLQSVFFILDSLKNYYEKMQKQMEVDINRLDVKKNPRESASLLQLMILIIMKNFNLNSKEAVALLSNDSKYLAHLLAKGLKGKFQPIQNFIIDLKKCVDVIQIFCKNKQNEVFFIKSIKPGPISKSQKVAQQSMQLIMMFVSNNHHKYQLLKEQLLNTFVLGIRRHPSLSQLISLAILSLSNYNKSLLENLKQNGNALDYQNIVFQIWKIGIAEQRSQQIMKMKGFQNFVENTINNLANSQLLLSALNNLINFCQLDSNIFIDGQRGSKIFQNLSLVTLSKNTDNIVFIHQLFSLLSFLGKDKNSLAPAIYKMIIQKYQQCRLDQQAKIFTQNFLNTLQLFPSIPSSLIVQAINSRAEAGILDVSIPQVNLFKIIIDSQNVDIKIALIIYNIVSRILLQDPSLGLWTADFIATIVQKYSNEQIIIDMTLKLLKVCLAVHYANVKKVVLSRRSVIGGIKGSSDQIILIQLKNLIIQQFIKKILQLNLKQFTAPLEPLLAYSYIQVESSSRQNAQGLFKLLKIIGDPEQLIAKYTQKKESQKKQRGKSHKQSPLKHRYNIEDDSGKESKLGTQIGGSEDQINLLTRKKGLSGSGSNSLYLSHLTAVGVQPDAQKGLQKYHKVYLQKVQKFQQEKAKKIAQQQRTSQMKKLFQRKLHEIGISARPNQPAQCLYEFDVKQKKMEQDKVKGKVDISQFKPENQQQRDLKALQYFMKKYNRSMKLYFNQYLGGKKIGAVKNFDQIAQKFNLIQIASTWKMLKDHTLDEFISLEQTKHIVRKINYNLKKQFFEPLSMDLEGFEQFILQVSFAMFTRPPKDLRGHPVSQMVDQTFSRFRLYAADNRMDPQIFQEPESIYYNQTEAVKQLNKKLQQNPNYIVPQGYKKVVDKKVNFAHQIFLQAMSPTYKQVYEVLDQILYQGLNFHIIQPFSICETITRARPALYYNKRIQGDLKSQPNLSYSMKKQVAKIPIKDRQIAKQAAGILSEIVQAVEFGHTKIGQKIQNKLIKDKKKIQFEARQRNKIQQKRRMQRDKQLKNFLQQQKEKITQKKKQDVAKRVQQKKKVEQQKKKRQKQQEQLKKKVEQYKIKKKQQQKKQRIASRQRKNKQKQQFQKKKKQGQQIKKKIEEHNSKRIEEQNERKKRQAQQEKKRKQQQKRRYEQKQKEAKQKVEEYKMKKSTVAKGDRAKSPSKNEQGQQAN